jgi:hypothetical protein
MLVAAGELLRESGLLTGAALAPDQVIGGQLVARAPRPQLAWRSDRGWGISSLVSAPAASLSPVDVPVGAPDRTPVPNTPDMWPSPSPTPAVALTAPASSALPTPTMPVASPTAPPAVTPTRTVAPAATQTPQRQTPTPTAMPAVPLQPGAAPVIRTIVNDGRAEHAVIANDGTVPQELTGWRLRSVTGGQAYAFPPGFTLAPGGSVRVHSGQGDATSLNRPPTDLYATGSNIWRNAGDTAQLVDPFGTVVHQYSYGTT